MNRRRFLQVSGTAATGLGASHILSSGPLRAESGSGAKGRRPNILYIMTDQQFGGAMSCAGDRDVKTPAMDSLAKTGTLFDRAYCAQPLCVPSRTVMMTGRMPHETGVEYNRTRKRLRVPTMGRIFSAAGYDTGYVGKWHLPFTEPDTRVHGFSSVTCKVGASSKTKKDADVPPACEEFLKRPRSKPFLLVASLLNPHDICQVARGDALPNGPIGDPPPPDKCPPLLSNFAIPPNEPDILRAIQKKGPRIYPSINWPPDKWRQYRWAYYRLIEMVDAEIGKILATLRKTGQEDNTVVIFSSDHGDGMGAHRWNQKQVLYEQPARVPFIVSCKGVTRPGHIDRDHLVSSGLDLIPTMCDYAGIETPTGLRGLSVRPLAEGRSPRKWRDFVVTETTLGGSQGSLGVAGRMLRTNRHKYIVYSRGRRREQLFDMDKDPGETVNLAVSGKHKRVLDEHRRRLATWCKDTGDRFVAPLGA